MKGQHATLTVDPVPGPFHCPEGDAEVRGYDRKLPAGATLDTCQFTSWIVAEVLRIRCPTHGVKQFPVPWAESGSQFTALFGRSTIDVLRGCSVTAGAALLRISWDETWGIEEWAVRRGLAHGGREPVAHLGVDERAIAKRHKYLAVVADLDRPRILLVAEDRKQSSLDAFWATLATIQGGVRARIALYRSVLRMSPALLSRTEA